MPIQPNILERTAFRLNAAPGPMLDLAGALAYQTLSTAIHLDIFDALHERPASPAELAQMLDLQERGASRLLHALEALGYVTERNGRYHNTRMTEKWVLGGTMLDMKAAMTSWDVFLREFWPHGPAIVRSGERPFDFYEYTAAEPGLSHAHQRMMMSSAHLVGADIARKVALPETAGRLLDVGGGHGQFTIDFCEAYPQLTATIMDGQAALETARENVEAAGLNDRIDLRAADMWETGWGTEWDLILLFNLLHHFDMDTNRTLLQRAHAALKPGGKVAIFDQMAGKQFGSATNAMVQLVGFMYYLFIGGRAFTREELTGLLADTGFRDVQFYGLRQAPGNSLLVAQK